MDVVKMKMVFNDAEDEPEGDEGMQSEKNDYVD